MITHIVFFNIKPELNKEEVLKNKKKRLLNLNHSIKELKHLEFGINFNSSPASYDAALYSTFDSKKDLETYQNHPEHIEAKEYIADVTTTRAVVDYEI